MATSKSLSFGVVLFAVWSTHAYIVPPKYFLNNRNLDHKKHILKSDLSSSNIESSVGTTSGSASSVERVPCSIVGGYFYCGKTTFVRNALQNNNSLHVGVVVAEMDEVTKALQIDSKDSKEIVELENQCMFCETDGDIFGTISRLLMANKLKHPNKPFDHILIETSAYAEPRAMTKQFEQAELCGLPLMKKVKYGNMITVVDSLTFCDFYKHTDHYNRGDGSVYDKIMERVEYADVVIANKIDRRTDEVLMYLREIIKDLNPVAKSFFCVNISVDMAEVFNSPAIDHTKRQIRGPLPELKKKRGHSTFVYTPKTAFIKGHQAAVESNDSDSGPTVWKKGMKFKDPVKDQLRKRKDELEGGI